MFKRHSRAYRLTLLCGVVVILGGLGFLGYRYFTKSSDQNDQVRAAEQAYNEGSKALDDKNAGDARESLGRANLLTEKALTSAKEERGRAGLTPDRARELETRIGKLLWLKARIIRDDSFAQALAEGNPIKEIQDSVTREVFRFTPSIRNPKDLEEAIACIRQASRILVDDLELQQEAVRVEQWLKPTDWNAVQRLANNMLKIDPANTRAHLLLARIEFEQFQEGTGKPATGRNRNRERVEDARSHLAAVKKAPPYPLWRTLYLEAQIVKFLVKEKPASNRAEQKKDEAAYSELFFDPEGGVLALAARRQAFGLLAADDIEGIIGLHEMAVELGIEQSRKTMGGDTKNLYLALNSFVDVAQTLAATEMAAPMRGRLFEASVAAASRARRAVGGENPPEWISVRDKFEKLAEQMIAANVSQPPAYANLAQLLNLEAYQEGLLGHVSARKDLHDRAFHFVGEGLRLGKGVEPAVNLIDLHGVALEVLNLRGDKLDAFAPHLEALRNLSENTRATAILNIQEASVFVRQGKLSRAKTALEQVLKTKENELRPLRPAFVGQCRTESARPCASRACTEGIGDYLPKS